MCSQAEYKSSQQEQARGWEEATNEPLFPFFDAGTLTEPRKRSERGKLGEKAASSRLLSQKNWFSIENLTIHSVFFLNIDLNIDLFHARKFIFYDIQG